MPFYLGHYYRLFNQIVNSTYTYRTHLVMKSDIVDSFK